MADIIWHPYARQAPPCDAAELDAFEAEVGATLPQDYRDLLGAHAGQASDPDVIAVGDGDTPFGPIYFLDRTLPKRTDHLNGWVVLRRMREWIGNEKAAFAPIAWNGSKGTFFYDLREGEGGRIKFADLYYDPDEPDALFDIADDVEGLFARLIS